MIIMGKYIINFFQFFREYNINKKAKHKMPVEDIDNMIPIANNDIIQIDSFLLKRMKHVVPNKYWQ